MGGVNLRKTEAPRPLKPAVQRPAFLTQIEGGTVQLRAVTRVQALPRLEHAATQMSLMHKLRQCVEERRAKMEDDAASEGGESSDGWSDDD
jgi:hypothetical protein